MATQNKNLSDTGKLPDGNGLCIGIVVSEWNEEVTGALEKGCVETLKDAGVKEDDITKIEVPGSFELPYGARLLISQKKLDAVICIGCVIKGETKHDEYISQSVANGITQLSLMSNTPVIFGVLTPNNQEQAVDRSGGKHGNKGVEAAVTAIKMALLKKQFKDDHKSIGFS